MIDVKNNESTNILEAEFVETFTQADLDHFIPIVEKHVAEATQPRMLIIMNEFAGWDKLKTFISDVELDTKYMDKFDRVALVGDKKWEEWSTKFFNLFSPNEVRFFKPENIEHARKWLKQ